ncbi:MAG: MgtE intracellular region [Firmicutes bacterium]|nr:MgtE intracellular region [Bacillota bacterium]
MLTFTEVFLSQLIGQLVIDKVGKKVGKVVDVLIVHEPGFPRVVGIKVKRSFESVVIGEFALAMMNKQIVSLSILRNDIQPLELSGNEIFLRRDLMDRQIVDIDGAKVVRVNDLKLAQVNNEYRLMAVDIGLRGLVRRLGVERILKKVAGWFSKDVSEKLISWDYVDMITPDLSAIKLSVAQGKLASLHPHDVAQIVSELSAPDRSAIFQTLNAEKAAETLAEMETDLQASILEEMSSDRAADILEMMATDDAADVLNEMEEDKAQELLNRMKYEEAVEVGELREYEEDEAGSLMATEYIALPQHLTADETINELRRLAPEAETIYYIYVINEEEHLVGVLSLRELIVAPPQAKLADLMQPRVITVGDEAAVEDVFNLIRKYDLLAVPVTDVSEKLVGIITVDDVIDAALPRRKRNKLRY